MASSLCLRAPLTAETAQESLLSTATNACSPVVLSISFLSSFLSSSTLVVEGIFFSLFSLSSCFFSLLDRFFLFFLNSSVEFSFTSYVALVSLSFLPLSFLLVFFLLPLYFFILLLQFLTWSSSFLSSSLPHSLQLTLVNKLVKWMSA